MELFVFNHELVPWFIAGCGQSTKSQSKWAPRFMAVSLYLRGLLDRRGSGQMECVDEGKVAAQLLKLNIRLPLTCELQDHRMRQCAVLRCSTFSSMKDASYEVRTIQNADDAELRTLLERITSADYLKLVELLFLIRPSSPVSLLRMHSQKYARKAEFLSRLSSICGNLMVHLATDHFHQALAIGHLPECEGIRHPSTLVPVFSVLVQKCLRTIRNTDWIESRGYDHALGSPLAVRNRPANWCG